MTEHALPAATTLLLKGGQVLTPDADAHKPPQLDVAIAGDRIAAVAAGFSGPTPAGMQTIDARGHLVLPGFVNAHYHSHDVLAKGTLEEARRLWATVARPNLMIKVPATAEGVPAIKALLSEGVNVNVTLLFARERYEEVARTYLEGIEGALAAGRNLATIASVASFFVSRIDTLADSMLQKKIDAAAAADRPKIQALLGRVAVANAILLVTLAEQVRRQGESPLQTSIHAARARLRPVLMTSAAMIAGMTPMALGFGEGAEATAPLGRAVIGGLALATFATLVVLPSVYTLAQGSASTTSASLDPDDPDSAFRTPRGAQ